MRDHIAKAISQLGIEEKPIGSNWGEDVEKYLLCIGIDFPAPWCMAFVYWCVNEAGVTVPDGKGGFKNPLVKTASVLNQWAKITTTYKETKPMDGDIFIMDFGGGVGHTGFVESVDPDGVHINTIEGNTNDTGSREGYEVCHRKRTITSCKGFIRI